MSFRDGQDYDVNYEFSREELGAVTPTDVCNWFKFRAYGTANPLPNANPTEARSSSLLCWEKGDFVLHA